jgi:alkylation response protein AidB-like acyl-CoA dehydrogenase
LVEGHCDALRIIEQAGTDPLDGVYGVWASRSVGTGLERAHVDGRWVLSGELRFASGIDLIDRALVPVRIGEGEHQLIDVRADLGTADPDVWQTSGMDAARTFTVRLDEEPASAQRVGPPNFYLERPGFVVGGLCVAAVWAGGVQQILEVVAAGVRDFPTTPHQLGRLGVIEEAAWTATLVLRSTVSRISELAADEVAREIDLARTSVVRARVRNRVD